MKFEAGSEIDSDLCRVLEHEFYRCQDAFEQFEFFGKLLIQNDGNKKIAYYAYNSYAYFILHLYEFLQGCMARELRNTNITNKNNEVKAKWIEGYINRNAQQIMDRFRDDIMNGTAPSWVNDIRCYDVKVPGNFGQDFRKYRNKVAGHVAYERAASFDLSDFYSKYHKYLYSLYRASVPHWGKKDDMPDLKQITSFSLLLKSEKQETA
jgi:hypothetical protein